MRTAVAGTVFIAAGAFWLSYTALADLARRSGIGAGQAWAWPLIVDGIIVVATVAVVALAGHRAAWYPWTLLGGGAAVSVTANAIHAILTADVDVPPVLAASVAAVPPVVLLAITHLTVILTRTPQHEPVAKPESSAGPDSPTREQAGDLDDLPLSLPAIEPASEPADRRECAAELRLSGWSNKRIARHLGVHPSTVGRWFTTPESEQEELPEKETEDVPPVWVEEVRTP
ncbi:DUF2637 domain-containing protein [Ornithinimicrobium panacihumi]|uniref:DUF2637 domain-containing protein n=1 Tax=Ornithinimicrobium panacihumi TaxID=2008449 RepID=UPI003F8BFC49